MSRASAIGEQELAKLLADLQPILDPQAYVFCTTNKRSELTDEAFAIIKEDEAWTMVLNASRARALGFDDEHLFCRITLMVHSSLHAVGLTATVAEALMQQNISANIVAAFYHDHLFVSKDDAERALTTLQRLTAASDDNQLLR